MPKDMRLAARLRGSSDLDRNIQFFLEHGEAPIIYTDRMREPDKIASPYHKRKAIEDIMAPSPATQVPVPVTPATAPAQAELAQVDDAREPVPDPEVHIPTPMNASFVPDLSLKLTPFIHNTPLRSTPVRPQMSPISPLGYGQMEEMMVQTPT